MHETQDQAQMELIAKAVSDGVTKAFALQKAAEDAAAKEAAEKAKVAELEAQIEALKGELEAAQNPASSADTPEPDAPDVPASESAPEADGAPTAEGGVTKSVDGGAAISEEALAAVITKAVQKGNRELTELITKAYATPKNLNGAGIQTAGTGGDAGLWAGVL